GGAALTGALLAWLLGYPLAAGLFALAGLIGVPAAALLDKSPQAPAVEKLNLSPDFSVIGSTLSLAREPAALTDGDGKLLVANSAYRDRFGPSSPPLTLGSDDDGAQSLRLVKTMAWRDGGG